MDEIYRGERVERRTFASVLYAIGEDPGVVMDEMGHTDQGLALRDFDTPPESLAAQATSASEASR